MAEPTRSTLKRLYTLSSNACAFPGCTIKVVEAGVLVGETCHIRGEKPTSARYDSTQSDAERHGFENLVVMCGGHHTVIDTDAQAWTVERLISLKKRHEAYAETRPALEVSESLLDEILAKLAKGAAVGVGAGVGLAAVGIGAQAVRSGGTIADELNSFTRSIGNILGFELPKREAPSPAIGYGVTRQGQKPPPSSEELARLVERLRHFEPGHVTLLVADYERRAFPVLDLFSAMGWEVKHMGPRELGGAGLGKRVGAVPMAMFEAEVKLEEGAQFRVALQAMLHPFVRSSIGWQEDVNASRRVGHTLIRAGVLLRRRAASSDRR